MTVTDDVSHPFPAQDSSSAQSPVAFQVEGSVGEANNDTGAVETLCGALELNIDQPDSVWIETLRDLDAALIAKPESYKVRELLDKPRKPTDLQQLIRAKLVEFEREGVAACFDPLAGDKARAAKALKKVGLALEDLPVDFWSLPRIAKVPFARSRQNEFFRIVEGRQNEIRELERMRKLEQGGRPANYDRLSLHERNQVDAKLRQRKHRSKKRKPPTTPARALLPLVHIGGGELRSALHSMSSRLQNWASVSSEPRARQLRQPAQQSAVIRAAAAYSRYYQQNDRPPSQAELAKWLHCSADQARRKIDLLWALYAPQGPWAST